MQISNRQIILTGAASGIGQALLTKLSNYPCQILATDIDAARLDDAVNALGNTRATIYCFTGDLAQPAEIDRLLAEAVKRIGGCDLCFANAGFAYYEAIGAADWAHIERIFQLNTFSPIYTLLRLRELNPQRPYRVVVTASAMAKFGLPGYALYSATKAALDCFADAYRYELAPRGRLAVVYPTATRTNFFRAASADQPPIPWPSQSPEQVAGAIIRGVERGQNAIFPAAAFRWTWKLGEVFPPLRIGYQVWQQRVLARFLGKR